MKLSVIICTYNGGARLGEVLHCLSVQTGLSRDFWELLIVDNASTDGRSMSRAIDASVPLLSPSNGSATLKKNPPMTSGNASPA
jgi:glycosyltransferase involved in cell wall biosynthesis